MSASRRRWLIAAGLALTFAATGWVASQEGTDKSANAGRDPPAARRREQHAKEAPAEPMAEVQLEKLRRPAFEEDPGEMFPSRTWQPPPPPPPPPGSVKEEPPRAPPLPFVYFGQMSEEGEAVVFLTRGNRDYAVKQGGTIEGGYRIDEIRRDAIVMTYLPLAQQQTLAIGSLK